MSMMYEWRERSRESGRLSGKLGGKSQGRQMRASWWERMGGASNASRPQSQGDGKHSSRQKFYKNIGITMGNVKIQAWGTLSGGRQLEDAEADDEEGGWVSVSGVVSQARLFTFGG